MGAPGPAPGVPPRYAAAAAPSRLATVTAGKVVGEPIPPAAEAEASRQPLASVRQVGSKTFYYKDRRWVDSSVTPDEDAKATVVAPFSDDFFRLARTQKAEFNQYLTFEEPVTVKLDGQVYRFEQARP